MIGAGLDLQSELAARGALLQGHFRLSSGRHSDWFVQKFRILENPSLLEPVGRAIGEHFRSLQPTIVVSAAIGGILLGYEVARHLGIKAVFIEKEHAVPMLRRGFTLGPQDRALIVEDVVTTGLSVREVIALVRDHGTTIVGIGAIIVRDSSTFSKLAMSSLGTGSQGEEIPVYALLDLPLQSYSAEECPQCRAGAPISDPGSRRV